MDVLLLFIFILKTHLDHHLEVLIDRYRLVEVVPLHILLTRLRLHLVVLAAHRIV